MIVQPVFTRDRSVVEVIEGLLRGAQNSIDAALYRLNNPRLARSLAEAARRGVAVRLVLDRGKFGDTSATRELMARTLLPFRLIHGRRGEGSKMHHKFAILDHRTVLAGSYNWTLESEHENFDYLLIIRDRRAIAAYQKEFKRLWLAAISKDHSP